MEALSEYPKTENLWARDKDTHIMSPANGVRMEEVEQIKEWLVLEKIDGMNMRVVWTPDDPSGPVEPCIFGRTERAQIPGDLHSYIASRCTYERLAHAFRDEDGDLPHFVILFGEGYGAGIQQGGHYREDKSLALFDVVVNGTWLRWADVQDIAYKLDLDTVPVIGKVSGSFVGDVLMPYSQIAWSTEKPEGIIARTDPYLFDQRGRRVMFKHKFRDVNAWLASEES